MSPSDSVEASPAPKSFKALEDLVSLLAEVANAVIAAPKPLKVSDLSMLLPHIPAIEALALEIGELPGELADLDEEEGAALVLKVASVLSLKDPHAEAVVDAALKFAVAGLELAKAIKG